VAALGTAFLESQQLPGAEGLVVDLGRRFNEVLEVGASEKISEIDEFAVVFVFYVDYTPAVLAATDFFAANDDGFFGADDGEGDDVLDLGVESKFLLVKLVVVVRVHFQVMKRKFFLYSFLKCTSLLQGKGVRLGDNWHNIDDIRELLQDSDINRLERVT